MPLCGLPCMVIVITADPTLLETIAIGPQWLYSIFDFVKPASGCGGERGKEAKRRGRWFPCGGYVYVVVKTTRCVGAGARLGGRRCESTTRRALCWPSGNCNKRQVMGAGRLDPGLKSATEQLCIVSEYRSNEAAPNRVGSRQAGRLVGHIMPEARVESRSENTAKLHKNDRHTLQAPGGGAPQSAAGIIRLKLAP